MIRGQCSICRGTFSSLVNSHWNVQNTVNANKYFVSYFVYVLCVFMFNCLIVYIGLLIKFVIGTIIIMISNRALTVMLPLTSLYNRIWLNAFDSQSTTGLLYELPTVTDNNDLAPNGAGLRSCHVGLVWTCL